jgi:hypothetical protein
MSSLSMATAGGACRAEDTARTEDRTNATVMNILFMTYLQ